MSKDHWDAILASSPLNATAGRVVAKGVHFETDRPITERHWENPPRMRKPPANAPDLIGHRFGRLAVVGLLDESAQGRGAWWVCRCACGHYCGRKAKAICNPENITDMCSVCDYTNILRKRAEGDRARHRAESEKARKWTPAA